MESKNVKAEKKNRKREAESGSLLRGCSSSSESKKGRTEPEPTTESAVKEEKKKSMKGEKTEAADSESKLRGCSSSSPTETQTSLVPEKKKKKKKKKEEEEEEKETTTATESKSEDKEEEKKKKKSRKRGKTESGSILRGCSSSSRTETETSLMQEEKKKAEQTTTESEAEEKKIRYGSLKPLITTVTSTTTITASITIITPPEDPNNHIHLYFCVDNGLDNFTWFEIDTSNTTVEPPKYISISSNPYRRNNNYHSPVTRIFPISQMPPMPIDFHVIPQTSPTKEKKLVYAIGGGICPSYRSSRAFVCDFASSSPTWQELPPMPSQLQILIGAANPLNGNVFAFGYMFPKVPSHPRITMGLIFDPSSTSWNHCPHPFDEIGYPNSINDYALIDTEDKTQLCVFTSSTNCHRFNLTAAHWEYPLYGIVPKDRFSDGSVASSSVGVGHIIFKFHNRKLYAYNSSSSPKPSFEPVLGMENEFTMCRAGTSIAYLGKGKLCIVWDTNPDPPAENAAAAAPKQTKTLYIHCLKFWVGMCNGTNRLRAVMDRCETFSAHGGVLYSVVAL